MMFRRRFLVRSAANCGVLLAAFGCHGVPVDAADAGYTVGADGALDGCTRQALLTTVDDYFDALEANDANQLALTDDVKFTENGAQLKLDEGLFANAGATRFKRTAVDTERCGTHTQAVVKENDTEVIYGVRLRTEDGAISEIEAYVAREGNYVITTGASLFSPDQLVQSEQHKGSTVRWGDVVPEEQRSSRERLVEIADLYFQSFGPAGIVAPIRNDCFRWENGVRTTSGDCAQFLPEPGTGRDDLITHRRYEIVDVELGIVVGYVKFRGRPDYHMFKVVDDEVRLIQAVVADDGGVDGSGWD